MKKEQASNYAKDESKIFVKQDTPYAMKAVSHPPLLSAKQDNSSSVGTSHPPLLSAKQDNLSRVGTSRSPIQVPSERTKIPLILVPGKKGKLVGYLAILAFMAFLTVKTFLLLFVVDPIIGVYGFMSTFLIFLAFFFSYLKYQDPSIPNKNSNLGTYLPLLSVIIPSKNDGVLIRKVAEACLNSTYEKTQVILVNDGSTDDTGTVMDSLKNEYPDKVEVIHQPKNMGKRKAILAALNSNQVGEIVVLIDSDSIVEATALERLVQCFRDPDVGAVTAHGRALNAEQNILTKIQDTWYDGTFFIMKGMESSFNSVTCCSGILSAYRKVAISPCLERWANDKFLGAEFQPGDDRHLTAYVLGGNQHYIDKKEKKWKVVYCESAKVKTEVPSKFRKWANQQIRWKKSWLRVFLFMAPFYFKDRSIVPVITYYVQMSLSLISPIISFRALVFLPLSGKWEYAILYLLGLTFIGLMYGFAFKARNPEVQNRWLYRLLFTPLSIVMSWLLYYALLTIKKNSWLTR